MSPAEATRQQSAFTHSLTALESHLQALSDALITGDAPTFEAHCATLVPLITAFAHIHQTLPPAIALSRPMKSRLRTLGNNLAQQRENMARRAVGVERELQVLLPPQPGSTYGKSAGGYGQAVRAMGSFASLHA